MREFQAAEWLRGNHVRKFFFTLISGFGIAGLLVISAERSATGQANRDNIQYNVVYECANNYKFKVLRCGSEMCVTWQINEYNPEGGFELEMTRKSVLYNISTKKCSAPGGVNNIEPQTQNKEGTQNEEPQQQPNNTTGKVACPASDPDSKGKTALEKEFRGAIREGWEVEPRPGLDGKVTIMFQAFSVGAPHKYRVYVDPDEARGKTIYPVRATFTTCTDYNRSIEITKREREFSCYKNTASKWACTIIAAPNTNVRDKTQSIDKPSQE